jgi:hypothetical protein
MGYQFVIPHTHTMDIGEYGRRYFVEKSSQWSVSGGHFEIQERRPQGAELCATPDLIDKYAE